MSVIELTVLWLVAVVFLMLLILVWMAFEIKFLRLRMRGVNNVEDNPTELDNRVSDFSRYSASIRSTSMKCGGYHENPPPPPPPIK